MSSTRTRASKGSSLNIPSPTVRYGFNENKHPQMDASTWATVSFNHNRAYYESFTNSLLNPVPEEPIRIPIDPTQPSLSLLNLPSSPNQERKTRTTPLTPRNLLTLRKQVISLPVEVDTEISVLAAQYANISDFLASILPVHIKGLGVGILIKAPEPVPVRDWKGLVRALYAILVREGVLDIRGSHGIHDPEEDASQGTWEPGWDSDINMDEIGDLDILLEEMERLENISGDGDVSKTGSGSGSQSRAGSMDTPITSSASASASAALRSEGISSSSLGSFGLFSVATGGSLETPGSSPGPSGLSSTTSSSTPSSSSTIPPTQTTHHHPDLDTYTSNTRENREPSQDKRKVRECVIYLFCEVDDTT